MNKRSCLESSCGLAVISRRGLCRSHHEAEIAGPDKRCSKCEQRKPKTDFSPNSKARDGRHSWCQECVRVDTKARYSPEKQAAKHAAKKTDPLYLAVRKAAYDRWRTAHPERARAATMRWRKANPERPREAVRRYFARLKAATIEPVDYSEIIRRDGMSCHICDGEIPGMDVLHFDHVVPLARGGAHSMANIKPAHAACNLRKQDRLMGELA